MFKRTLRNIVATTIDLAPSWLAYRLRQTIEKIAFNRTAVVHDLPPIFHYWSNTWLRPRFEAIGFSSPDDFFFRTIEGEARRTSETIRVLCLGAGRCEVEIALMQRLVDDGVNNVHMVCIDLNGRMLRTAEAAARAAGVGEHFTFEVRDVNVQRHGERYDVVLANQCLHHFVELEAIFDATHAMLADDGVFATSDVIGRNGHRLWPEARAEMDVFWRSLAPKHKFDRTLGRTSNEYVDVDHSDVGFEGVRAQDILPLLVERFEFEVFAPYACLSIPVVERRFGWNFDADDAADRALVDALEHRDQTLLDAGTLKPTQLVAAMRKRPVAARRSTTHFAPADCIRPTR